MTDARMTQAIELDDRHPFDLEATAGSFDGRGRLLRLAHMATSAPALLPACARLALPVLKHETYDLTLFDLFSSDPADPWRAEVAAKSREELDRLEAELKSVTANLIKESIRICHLDLGRLHLKCGEPNQALRSFVRTREFTTTAGQVLEMAMAVIEVNVELRSWLQIGPYIVKAESALDRPGPSSSAASSGGGVPLSAAQARAKEDELARREAEKRRIGTRLQVARALSSLGQGAYERAAREFLAVEGDLGEWGRTVISPSELAVLGGLTSLATLRRSALRSEVLQNESFRRFVDDEPHVRELVEGFVEGKYRRVLDLLDRHSTQHLLMPYLAPHLSHLTASIRRLALLQYFAPFRSVSLGRMAAAFGLAAPDDPPPGALLHELVELIRSGELEARIDLEGGILSRPEVDDRIDLLERALDEGEKAERETRRAIVRMRLVEEGLIITDPNHPRTNKAGKPTGGVETGTGGGGGGGGGGEGEEAPSTGGDETYLIVADDDDDDDDTDDHDHDDLEPMS